MNDTEQPQRTTVHIKNLRGLHARATAKFVKLASQFNAQVTVVRSGVEVPATSIIGLMMLAAGQGTIIEIRAKGAEAQAALIALKNLVNRRFDEE